MNELTKRLYAEGWTRNHYPDHVYWSDFDNFGYKWEFLSSLNWETPCGLFVNGKSTYGRSLGSSDLSFKGITYCAENDNPLLRCPLPGRKCKHVPAELPIKMCACHQTDKPYDCEHSVERLGSERDRARHEQYMEISGGQYCACIVGATGYNGGLCKVEYDVNKCIQFGCKNETCSIRKKPRDLTKVNIFYDIRKTYITRRGMLEDTKEKIEKGCRVFTKSVARTDAEIWLKCKKHDFEALQSKQLISPHLSNDELRQEYFSQHHRAWPGYDYFEFRYTVENIRIETRENRDLLQDLRDIEEGIEVVHASDLQKAANQKKKEDRAKRRKVKEEHPKHKGDKWVEKLAKEYPEGTSLGNYARKELQKRGIKAQPEQMSFFIEEEEHHEKRS